MQVIEIVTNSRQAMNNQSNNEFQVIQGDKWHNDFSPEVHVLAGMLVLVVSTTHLVIRQPIGVSQT